MSEGELPGPERPHVHLTPPAGWMNDPNGLVHVDGTWQLCYQHHPGSLRWGPMHWGRATSGDLVSWEHHPVALAPDDRGAVFSGSAVVDEHGTAGFGEGALVALYTHHHADLPQSQGVATSADGGATWSPYAGNPVLEAPPGVLDFRDPKVFRWGGATGHWVMVLAAGDEVVLHRSPDLLTWTECGRFGGRGARGGVWETPDLFELPVAGTGGRHWVLTLSVLAGGPGGGSGTQYFVGTFDGEVFETGDPVEEVRWVDHGADFYAPQSWSGAPDGRRVWIAWMSNWAYAEEVPATTWRGAMTVPRDLVLRPGPTGRPVLAQAPVPELTRGAPLVRHEVDLLVAPGRPWTLATAPAAYELRVRVAGATTPWAIELHRDDATPTRVDCDPAAGTVTVTRSGRGLGDTGTQRELRAPCPTTDGDLDLRLVVDTCSLEVFADGGRAVVTALVFPESAGAGVAVTSEAGELRVAELSLLRLGSGGPVTRSR